MTLDLYNRDNLNNNSREYVLLREGINGKIDEYTKERALGSRTIDDIKSYIRAELELVGHTPQNPCTIHEWDQMEGFRPPMVEAICITLLKQLEKPFDKSLLKTGEDKVLFLAGFPRTGVTNLPLGFIDIPNQLEILNKIMITNDVILTIAKCIEQCEGIYIPSEDKFSDTGLGVSSVLAAIKIFDDIRRSYPVDELMDRSLGI